MTHLRSWIVREVAKIIPMSTSVVGIDENESLLESKYGAQKGESLLVRSKGR